jgi:hypothetical protein
VQNKSQGQLQKTSVTSGGIGRPLLFCFSEKLNNHLLK